MRKIIILFFSLTTALSHVWAAASVQAQEKMACSGTMRSPARPLVLHDDGYIVDAKSSEKLFNHPMDSDMYTLLKFFKFKDDYFIERRFTGSSSGNMDLLFFRYDGKNVRALRVISLFMYDHNTRPTRSTQDPVYWIGFECRGNSIISRKKREFFKSVEIALCHGHTGDINKPSSANDSTPTSEMTPKGLNVTIPFYDKAGARTGKVTYLFVGDHRENPHEFFRDWEPDSDSIQCLKNCGPNSSVRQYLESGQTRFDAWKAKNPHAGEKQIVVNKAWLYPTPSKTKVNTYVTKGTYVELLTDSGGLEFWKILYTNKNGATIEGWIDCHAVDYCHYPK